MTILVSFETASSLIFLVTVLHRLFDKTLAYQESLGFLINLLRRYVLTTRMPLVEEVAKVTKRSAVLTSTYSCSCFASSCLIFLTPLLVLLCLDSL